MQLTTDKCFRVFHISSACKTGHHKKHQRAVCVWVCVKERAREKKGREISETDDLKAPHDHLLSVIHKASLTLHIFFLSLMHIHTSSQAERSGYSGWCYSRCGVAEVSMLWPCYPGKRESIRRMQREEETLYQKHISPSGCITAATRLQTQRCAHRCTNITCVCVCVRM